MSVYFVYMIKEKIEEWIEDPKKRILLFKIMLISSFLFLVLGYLIIVYFIFFFNP